MRTGWGSLPGSQCHGRERDGGSSGCSVEAAVLELCGGRGATGPHEGFCLLTGSSSQVTWKGLWVRKGSSRKGVPVK